MDTSDYPSLPNLARMHARLAADSRQVERIINSQLDAIERLFYASTLEDWQAVASVSRQLASCSSEEVSPEVVQQAQQLLEELNTHPAAGLKQPKHLAGLLAACREVRARPQK